MIFGYVRVSTAEQNEARQVESLKQFDVDEWYIEKVSAKDMNRPKLQEMLKYVRAGDTIVVHDFSRLARSTSDLLNILKFLKEKDAHGEVYLKSVKENIDTSTPTGMLMITVLAAINEFERANLLERQREGIAIAKAEGKYKGRKPVNIDEAVFNDLYGKYLKREISKPKMAKELGISRPTLDKLIKLHNQTPAI